MVSLLLYWVAYKFCTVLCFVCSVYIFNPIDGLWWIIACSIPVALDLLFFACWSHLVAERTYDELQARGKLMALANLYESDNKPGAMLVLSNKDPQ